MVKTFVNVVLHSGAPILQHVFVQLAAHCPCNSNHDLACFFKHGGGYTTNLQQSVLPNDTAQSLQFNRRRQPELERRTGGICEEREGERVSWWWLSAWGKCWQEEQKDTATRKQKRCAEHCPPHPQLHPKERKITTHPRSANVWTSKISTLPVLRGYAKFGRAVRESKRTKLTFKKNLKTTDLHSVVLSFLSVPFNFEVFNE